LVDLVRLSVPVRDQLERLVSEMTYNVLTGTLNPAHSLTHSLTDPLASHNASYINCAMSHRTSRTSWCETMCCHL